MYKYVEKCKEQEENYDPRIKYVHQLPESGKLGTLNRAAQHYEKEGQLEAALKSLVLILLETKRESADQSGNDIESIIAKHGNDFDVKYYSFKLRKDLLERAVFLAIQLKDFKQALKHH